MNIPDIKARQLRMFDSKWLIRECADILTVFSETPSVLQRWFFGYW
jgi:hypothetical protein